MEHNDGDGGPASPVDEKEKPGGKGGIADYLSAPRRKRKSYVVLALGNHAHQELMTGIEQFVRSNYKSAAVSMPRSIEDLTKNFSRQIVLLVFDDEFTELEPGLELIRDLKKRKNSSGIPVLFLTRHPDALINAYNKILLPFHESDDYINYPKAGLPLILSKVHAGLTTSYKRKSRRYKVDIGLRYDLLTDGVRYPGRILDLSIHGALVKAEDQRIFQPGEQLKLHLPVGPFLPDIKGDYLKLSCRVRRVFIAGTQAGVSFEHITDGQLWYLTQLLTGIVNDQLSRRATQGKKAARA